MNTKRAFINSTLGLGIVALAITGWATIGKAAPAASSTTSVVTAQTGNVLSSVSGTGNVIVPTQLAVNFDAAVSSAKITEVLAKVGDTVTAGQPLAKVDDTLTAQALATAQAQLASAQASLDKGQNAVTPAIVAQDAASANQASLAVSNAQAAVTNDQNTLATDQVLQAAAVAQAQQSLDDAQAKTTQDVANQQATVAQAQSQLDADNAALTAAQQDPAATPSAISDAEAAVAKDTQVLQSATEAQQSLALSANQTLEQANNNLTNAQNAAGVKLNSDQVAVDNAVRQVASANTSYQSTVASNVVKEQPPTADDLAGAQAGVLSAQNAVATAQRNESNTTLVAPAAGTIMATSATVGGSASGSSSSASSASSSSSTSSASTGLFTIDDLSALQVKVGFSESDAANVKTGEEASITFAALNGVTATGTVSQVDLTATTVSNVVTYYTYVSIDPSSTLTQVKPGMTATVQVVVEHADGVVSLPTSAITARGNTATVNVEIGSDPKKTTPTPITLGLRGDSAIEVTSGLKAGDKVVVIRQAATATTAAATTGGGAGFGGAGGGGFTPGAGRGGG
jgi:macrolide-specific efflux system membrane fusion protein